MVIVKKVVKSKGLVKPVMVEVDGKTLIAPIQVNLYCLIPISL